MFKNTGKNVFKNTGKFCLQDNEDFSIHFMYTFREEK